MLFRDDEELLVFRDRAEAGRLLSIRLSPAYANRDDVCVLALPRGGVVVGFEIAQALRAPLDVLVVRKLGVPERRELALGAIASGGVRVLNPDVINALGLTSNLIETVAYAETQELKRRELLYRGKRPPLVVAGRVAIVVDDGIATGSTMRAAIAALRQRSAAQVVVAVPVAPESEAAVLRAQADRVFCLAEPEGGFFAVSQVYEDFSQTSDDEVQQLLERASFSQVA